MPVCTKPDGKVGRMTFSLLRIPASVRLQTWACGELADCFSRTLLKIIKWGCISLREGEPSPTLLSSEFAALTRACCGWQALCWQQGWRWWWAPRGDELLGVMTKPCRPGEEWRRLKDARGTQVNSWKKPWKQGCNIHFSARLKSLLLLIKSLKYLKIWFQGSGSL